MAGERTSPTDPILSAASELFERQGYDGVSVAEIAARAGFARSTVFVRYRTKEALLIGIVRAFHEALGRIAGPPARTSAGTAHGPSGAIEAERVVRRLHETCQRLGPLARVAAAARELPWIRRAVQGEIEAFRDRLRDWFGVAGAEEADVDLLWDVLRRDGIGSTEEKFFDVSAATRRILRFRSPASATPRGRAARGPGPLRASG